jgi:hypothetical protein
VACKKYLISFISGTMTDSQEIPEGFISLCCLLFTIKNMPTWTGKT